jgi:putative PIN family toxin of toxin-antitoxin system
MRFVLDTNTIVSGIFWLGAPNLLLNAARMHSFAFYTCPELLAELAKVIERKKFAVKVAASGRDPNRLVTELLNISIVVTIPTITLACRDPKDDIVLACAVSVHADAIICGDKDLQVLKSYQNIPILNAAQALVLIPPPHP